MLDGHAGEQEREGDGPGDRDHPGLGVQPRQERPRGGESDREDDPHGDVDPEQVAGQAMIDVLALEDDLGESVQAEVHEQQAERRDHGQQSEIGRREQPSEDDGGQHLNGEHRRLGKHGDRGSAESDPPQPISVGRRAEGAVLVEGLQ